MSTNSSNFDNIPVGAQGTNSGVAQTNAQEGKKTGDDIHLCYLRSLLITRIF